MKRFVVLGAVMMSLAACGGDGSSTGPSASSSSTAGTTVASSGTSGKTSTAGAAATTTTSGKSSATSGKSSSTGSTGSTSTSATPTHAAAPAQTPAPASTPAPSQASTPAATPAHTQAAASTPASTPAVTSAPAPAQAQAQASTPAATFTLSGSPLKTATVGNWYEFKPLASSGATVTFSVTNAPRWATFNTATGELSGTPDAQDVGTYANITISASNGTKTLSLAAYSIAVTASEANSIALTWNPPTNNTDSSSLTNLAGYRIYYGHDAASMTQSVDVASPTAHSFELANLPAGEWYVSMVAYSTDGSASPKSTPVKVSI